LTGLQAGLAGTFYPAKPFCELCHNP